MKASEKGHTEIMKHLVEHKADVNAKNEVFTALTDGLFHSLIVLTFCDAAVVSAGWLYRAYEGLREGSH